MKAFFKNTNWKLIFTSMFSLAVSLWLIQDTGSDYATIGYIAGYMSTVMIIIEIADTIKYNRFIKKQHLKKHLEIDERKKKVIEYIQYLEKNGGTKEEIEEFCKENHMTYNDFEVVVAEQRFAGTPCEDCKNNTLNLGFLPMGYCRICIYNPKFSDTTRKERN